MKLSSLQRIVLVVGLTLIVLSFLFPCWKIHSSSDQSIVTGGPDRSQQWGTSTYFPLAPITHVNFRFIFTPPHQESYRLVTVDFTRLVVQVGIINLLTIGAVFLFPFRKDPN